MPGRELLAEWRETGAWWADEPPQYYARWRMPHGRIVEECGPVPIGTMGVIDPTEAVLRPSKLRDEKVALACGAGIRSPEIRVPAVATPYAALHVLSGYAFGRSVLFAEEIPRLAAARGIPTVLLADPHSLAGAFEFVREARRLGIRPLVGASIELPEGGEIVLVARDKQGYTQLSQLITACHLEEPRLFPLGSWERLARYSRGLLCLTGGDAGPLDRRMARGEFAEAHAILDQMVGIYGPGNVFIQIERSWRPWQVRVNQRLRELADRFHLTAVAGGAVTHRDAEQFPVQDIARCAQVLCTVEEVRGRKPRRHPDQPQPPLPPERAMNAESYLRSPAEMAALYGDCPELLTATRRIEERCDDDVLPGRARIPSLFPRPDEALHHLVKAGLALRYPRASRDHRRRLDHEMERIVRLGFADHFLSAWDMCRWAGEQGILFSGRGSVVDSAVAYCLGLSRIDAHAHHLHFDRFLPDDGSKRPDIDLDFESHRREDVRQYLVRRYGEDRVATVSAFGAYNTRGILREVGKAMGLSPDAIGFLAKRLHGGVAPDQLESAFLSRPELRDSPIPIERFRWVIRLAGMLADVPRNLRAHSSGVIIADRPIAEFAPVQWGGIQPPTSGEGDSDGALTDWLKVIQYDKRSAKFIFDKFDILCLRGQDVLGGAQDRIRVTCPDFAVERIPLDDPESFRAMRSGELIGIPQSASPAMRQAHMRLRTENLHDASLVQAGIRPGVGGAVKINELIARRRGLKPYAFDCPELEAILGHTYGIVVFQEQIDQLLQTFCQFGSGEAEEIRDQIHKRRREDYGQVIREEVIMRIHRQGFSDAVAEQVFAMIAGFKGYGFAQGHALAFAEISLRSVHCQQNYPAEYFAALLSAQPAGYYGPCTLANEARARGVAMLPPCIGRSEVEFSVEDVRSTQDPQIVFPRGGIRIGLMQLAGLKSATRRRIVASRPFSGLDDFVRRVRPDRDELETLVLAGALDGWHANRRALLWSIPSALAGAKDTDQVAFDLPVFNQMVQSDLPDFSEAERALHERRVLGLDVHRHLMAYERERVASRGGLPTVEARQLRPGRRAIVVGNPMRLRFPPTASGRRVVFFDLEDESGILNVTCFDDTYRRDGHAMVCSPYVTAIGVIQDRDGCPAFLAQRIFPYRPCLAGLVGDASAIPITTADFLSR